MSIQNIFHRPQEDEEDREDGRSGSRAGDATMD